MKAKKLLLASLLGAALVATSACNLMPSGSSSSSRKRKSGTTTAITSGDSSDTSSSDTSGSDSTDTSGSEGEKYVARIVVDSPTNVVVNQELNLEDVVTVHYSDKTVSNTDFTIEPVGKSADLVSVDGHKVTFIGEGTVSINVEAGDSLAKFSTSVLSQIKKDFADAIAPISDKWGYLELEADEDGQVTSYLGAQHSTDYTCFPSWDEDDDGNILPGGFMRVKSGTTYAYTLDQNYENLNVNATPYGNYDNYFVNMPFSMNASNFETKEYEDGEEYLYLDVSVPSASYSQYFDSFIEEYCYCQLAFGLNDNYVFDSMEVSKVEMDDGSERFLFTVNINAKASGEYAGSWYELLIYETDADYGLQIVQDYIDSGSEPQSKDFTDVKNRIKAIADAKNYTVNVSGHEYYLNDDLETVSSTNYTYNEVVKANAAQYEDRASYTDSEGTQSMASGLVEKDGSLYSYEYDATSATYPATLAGAGKTVYGDGLQMTYNYLAEESLWEGFFVSEVTTDQSGTTNYKLAVSKSRNFIYAFLSESYAGSYLARVVDYYITNAEVDFLSDSYADAFIELSANTVRINVQILVRFQDANALWDCDAVFSNVGTTGAIDTSIVYPA